jgi:hypothetical protein
MDLLFNILESEEVYYSYAKEEYVSDEIEFLDIVEKGFAY